jgi:hypothetical protein
MTIVKFSPLSSPSQKGVTITKIGITKIGIPIGRDESLKLGSQLGWIAKIGIPIFTNFSDPNFGDEVMESENFAFFENEYQKCQIPTFCEVSLDAKIPFSVFL